MAPKAVEGRGISGSFFVCGGRGKFATDFWPVVGLLIAGFTLQGEKDGCGGGISQLIERGGMLEAPGSQGMCIPWGGNRPRHILMAGAEGAGPAEPALLFGTRAHFPDLVGFFSTVFSSQQPYPVFEYHSLGVTNC